MAALVKCHVGNFMHILVLLHTEYFDNHFMPKILRSSFPSALSDALTQLANMRRLTQLY
jgi:hypothetical protein